MEIDNNALQVMFERIQENLYLDTLRSFGANDSFLTFVRCLLDSGCSLDSVKNAFEDYNRRITKEHEEGELDV